MTTALTTTGKMALGLPPRRLRLPERTVHLSPTAHTDPQIRGQDGSRNGICIHWRALARREPREPLCLPSRNRALLRARVRDGARVVRVDGLRRSKEALQPLAERGPVRARVRHWMCGGRGKPGISTSGGTGGGIGTGGGVGARRESLGIRFRDGRLEAHGHLDIMCSILPAGGRLGTERGSGFPGVLHCRHLVAQWLDGGRRLWLMRWHRSR